MISYIKGVIDTVEHDKVIIENNNMGYNVLMSQSATGGFGTGRRNKDLYIFTCKRGCHAAFWISVQKWTWDV